ncbi:MAG: hypothetical protein FP825_05820 [Hyphomonas sp.]|uniref:hypothetical protein n=1 Tax=Hyphomonas sp. TaxID=87 RepID=UPI001812F244|nr:hypothetical protein [Hyphomonas sp.]MBA3067985.1 hypothetical protein [Hyphomonas sp.]MBU3919718.1 hypothetical protein [Alphaproteobacteria bacterium]MBU4061323.1 hypothetical protein [Alphaproteobacteria bacterium]MBU4162576.1 hypothetical protein [Alphaproteobacteria bacterium]
MKRYLILAASFSVLGFASAQAQVFPSATHDNSARITQTGNLNVGTINQAVNNIINGQGNAEIIQSSNRGDAAITQTNANSAVPGGFDNTALIDQRRIRNTASIDQIHDYNATRDNRATIVQITPDALASIGQRGDKNTATIRQFNTSSTPTASIQQNGKVNTAIVRQEGANGFVDVRQGTFDAGAGISPETFNSRVEVDNLGLNANIFVSQIGQTHIADINEDGANGTITVEMEGSFNDVIVTQESTNGTVEIATMGTSFSNDVVVVQDISDVGSTARVTQSGFYGRSEIEQLDSVAGGGDNLADVDQSGVASGVGNIVSTILQNGGLNDAFVTQAGAFSLSDIMQTGVGHTATVTQ